MFILGNRGGHAPLCFLFLLTLNIVHGSLSCAVAQRDRAIRLVLPLCPQIFDSSMACFASGTLPRRDSSLHPDFRLHELNGTKRMGGVKSSKGHLSLFVCLYSDIYSACIMIIVDAARTRSVVGE